MNQAPSFELTGAAHLSNAAHMLDQICDHFVEHAEVERQADFAFLTSELGTARIELQDRGLLIRLAAPSETALQVARTSIAEHMFYFAGDEPLDLTWSETASRAALPNLHEAVVVSTETVTPQMRRVRLSCADVTPFVGAGMHVRILVPPRGRQPVWPGYRGDGRIAWPEGEDALVVRPYTIRAVDLERRELSIDIFQHPAPGIATPGGDFARTAQPGDVIGLLGPGSGVLPKARSMLLIGDKSALPAIARIAAEVPAGTRLKAIIEVLDAAEEQPLPTAGELDISWLHRAGHERAGAGLLLEHARREIAATDGSTFIWAACEKQDVREVRSLLKARRHDKKCMYVAWYWERSQTSAQPMDGHPDERESAAAAPHPEADRQEESTAPGGTGLQVARLLPHPEMRGIAPGTAPAHRHGGGGRGLRRMLRMRILAVATITLMSALSLAASAFAQAPIEATARVPATVAPALATPELSPLPAAGVPPTVAALPHDLSPWGMFMAADIVVKAVMVGLAFASFVTWTIWLAKALELAAAKARSGRAVRRLEEAHSLQAAAAAIAGKGGRLSGAVGALVAAALAENARSANLGQEGVKERVAIALSRMEARAGRAMAKGTGLLATIGSTAPFVGLFGTVWGIMNAFVAISQSKTTNLAVVAPGIAEALLATAIGLVAAIPAVIIYNVFARSIAGYRATLSDASGEILRHLSRDLERQCLASVQSPGMPLQVAASAPVPQQPRQAQPRSAAGPARVSAE